jgi:hypothetical protein
MSSCNSSSSSPKTTAVSTFVAEVGAIAAVAKDAAGQIVTYSRYE